MIDIFGIDEHTEKQLEKQVMNNFEKAYQDQKKRHDLLNKYIKTIGKDNIHRIQIGNNSYYKEEFKKWVSV